MLIPITFASSSPSNPKLPAGLVKISHDEVVLIELQGSLEVESNHPSEQNGKLVGKLKIDEAGNKPSLLIGHHLLEGKVASLSKPLAILRRSGPQRNADGTDQNQNEDDGMALGSIESSPDASKGEPGTGWEVIAIVKRKIVFSKRPMPVTGKQS